jgi:hypothetical protein
MPAAKTAASIAARDYEYARSDKTDRKYQTDEMPKRL